MTAALPWLDADTGFPDPEQALVNPPGLLAVGGDLSPERLLQAYRRGIFPWYSEGDPILWWSPDPRCVISPATFQPSRSLRQQLRRGGWRFSVNHDFARVISACAEPRAYTDSTWISPEIRAGYQALHTLGHAHAIEVWRHDELVGGLYGLAVGRMFCGESMFSRATDASKLAFWALMALCRHWHLPWVDCQLENSHLLSLGAGTMPRRLYLNQLRQLVAQPGPDWREAEAVLASEGFPVGIEATGDGKAAQAGAT